MVLVMPGIFVVPGMFGVRGLLWMSFWSAMHSLMSFALLFHLCV
jgi:hypothetical protein